MKIVITDEEKAVFDKVTNLLRPYGYIYYGVLTSNNDTHNEGMKADVMTWATDLRESMMSISIIRDKPLFDTDVPHVYVTFNQDGKRDVVYRYKSLKDIEEDVIKEFAEGKMPKEQERNYEAIV